MSYDITAQECRDRINKKKQYENDKEWDFVVRTIKQMTELGCNYYKFRDLSSENIVKLKKRGFNIEFGNYITVSW